MPPLPSTPDLALGKVFLKFFNSLPSATWPGTQQRGFFLKKIFAECPWTSTRQRGVFKIFYKIFAECHTSWHSAKRLLCRVSFVDTWQTIFFLFLTSKLFLQSSYNTWYSMFQCGTFLILFLYFFNLFHLIEFS